MAPDLRLRATWRIAAQPDAVHAVLADVAAYPSWWPSVVDSRADESDATRSGSGRIAVRGPLPYTLRVRLTQIDASDGVLAARIGGDLLGWCSWHVSRASDGGTIVVLQQHVMLQRRSLRAIARVATRWLRASHAAVMRSGEAGLRALLER